MLLFGGGGGRVREQLRVLLQLLVLRGRQDVEVRWLLLLEDEAQILLKFVELLLILRKYARRSINS